MRLGDDAGSQRDFLDGEGQKERDQGEDRRGVEHGMQGVDEQGEIGRAHRLGEIGDGSRVGQGLSRTGWTVFDAVLKHESKNSAEQSRADGAADGAE